MAQMIKWMLEKQSIIRLSLLTLETLPLMPLRLQKPLQTAMEIKPT